MKKLFTVNRVKNGWVVAYDSFPHGTVVYLTWADVVEGITKYAFFDEAKREPRGA